MMAVEANGAGSAARRRGDTAWQRVTRIARAEIASASLTLHFVERALSLAPASTFPRVRTEVYRALGVRIGRGSAIIAGVTLAGGGDITSRLTVGERSVLNGPLHLDLNASISIGDRVNIGHHVVMITSEHAIGESAQRCGPHDARPIVIEDGVWIGARATICPGVRIGRGSVVAVGAVVTADVPPNKVVGGNPARPIRTLPE